MRISVISSALLLAALAAPVSAQESTREDFKEFCKAIEGRWIGEVTWVADWPGFGKKGDKVTAYSEASIVEDGHALILKGYGGQGSGTTLFYFDAAAKQIKAAGVNSGGAVGQDVVYKKGDQWIIRGTGCLADGTKVEGTTTVTISDNGNTHTLTGTATVGGKKTDNQHDVYRRVSKK